MKILTKSNVSSSDVEPTRVDHQSVYPKTSGVVEIVPPDVKHASLFCRMVKQALSDFLQMFENQNF